MNPDFSGEWVLDRPASRLGPGADAVHAGVLRIDHREPLFRCSASFLAEGHPREFSFERSTDGREVAVGKEVSRLYWDGAALVSEDRTDTPDRALTIRWRYELIDGGRRLRAREQLRAGGRDQDNIWVFERH